MGLEVAMFAMQAMAAVKGFVDQRKAAKETKKSNAAATAQAEQNARLSREEGAETARQARLDAKRVRSSQIAAFLQSGVTLDGSPLLVTDETTDLGEKSSQAAIKNAEARAEGFILEGQASQKPVQKADIFGTAMTVLGAAKGASDAGAFSGKENFGRVKTGRTPTPSSKPKR